MTELVRDDQLDLSLARRREQRVEEDDAPRRADAGHVCVHPGRAPARVGDEHVAHGRPGLHRERAQLVGEPSVGERAEAVEERLEHDRCEEREDEHRQRERRRRRQRPPAGQRPGERHRPCPGNCGEDESDRERLRPVDEPAREGLRREAEPALAHVPAPDRERQPHEL